MFELGAADYDLLARYWNEEPWGSVRDNVHAALIAREIRRGNYKGEHKLSDFILKSPDVRVRDNRSGVFGFFRAMVKGNKQP